MGHIRYSFNRSDETIDATVEYELTSYAPGLIDTLAVFGEDDQPLVLSDEERRCLDEYIYDLRDSSDA